jgi:hypothetical protein
MPTLADLCYGISANRLEDYLCFVSHATTEKEVVTIFILQLRFVESQDLKLGKKE